jgi:hypothetical protein
VWVWRQRTESEKVGGFGDLECQLKQNMACTLIGDLPVSFETHVFIAKLTKDLGGVAGKLGTGHVKGPLDRLGMFYDYLILN